VKLTAPSALISAILAAAVVAAPGPAASAARDQGPATFLTINGSGSSWAGLAIDQWSQDLRPKGLVVNYNPDGSQAGREDYIYDQDDFAASDVPFRNGRDKLAGTKREVVPFGYSYVPDMGDGVTFIYHLSVGGHQVRNLKLSGRTLMKIFTGRITNWDNPQITKDYGAQLPDLKITPVVDSDGGGPTYYFTRWMAHVFTRQWNAFCLRVTRGRVTPPCGPTEIYPTRGPGWHPNAQVGSNNVASYIAGPRSNGAIGFEQYAYALFFKVPVLKLRNPAGRYVAPTPEVVKISLAKALIDEDRHSPNFLQENLNPLYTDRNPKSYPLAYYGYLIVPRSGTKLPPIFTRAAGRSLSTLLDFALCAGQRQVTALGDAPLPRILVAGGLRQVRHIPGHVKVPTLSRCLAKRR
jgi:ABC-type phosphate transport system substrate-binding protein